MGELAIAVLMRELICRLSPSYGDVARRFKDEQDKKPHKPYDEANILGKVSKHYLRCIIESAPRLFKSVHEIEGRDSYYSTDNGCQMLVETAALDPNRKDVCTIDTLTEFNGRTALIDIRASDWANIRENYFTKRKGYVPILDAIFGQDAYDRILLLCSDVPPTRDEIGRRIDKRFHRGVHIVKLQLELAQLERMASNIGRQYKLLRPVSPITPKTTSP